MIILLVILLVIFIIVKAVSASMRDDVRTLGNLHGVAKQGGASDNTVNYACNGNAVIVDDDNLCLWIADGYLGGMTHKVPYSDLLGCEVYQNSRHAGGVGRAAVGAVLAGPVGAVVGAATRKEKVNDFRVVLYLRDTKKPQITMQLANAPMKPNSFEYSDACNFAENVRGTVGAILARNYQPAENQNF